MMTDPRQARVERSPKKNEVADRTLNERKFCKLCDYYYSEMFTCPICYGERKAENQIIKLLEEAQSNKCKAYECKWPSTVGYGAHDYDCGFEVTKQTIELIKGETNE